MNSKKFQWASCIEVEPNNFQEKKHRSSSDLKLTKCLRLVRFLIWEVESCFSLWWKCWCYHIYCRICSLILVSFLGMLSLIVEPCFPLLENCCCLYLDSSHDLLIFFLQATTMMCNHPLMFFCLFVFSIPKSWSLFSWNRKLWANQTNFPDLRYDKSVNLFFIREIINVSRKVFYWERFQFWKSEENCPIIRFWKIFM